VVDKMGQVIGAVGRRFWPRESFLSFSNGVTSANSPIVTNKDGLIDQSFLSGTDMAEYIADTVGAMVTGNTETYLTVTYQDSDNTLDFALTPTAGTWTPEVADAASGGNAASATVAYGEYTRIGDLVWAGCRITQINTTGLTAGNAVNVRGFPYASNNASSNYRATGTASVNNITFGGYVSVNMLSNTSAVTLVNNASGAAGANILVSALTSGTALIQFSIVYRAQ
jgi:hypothetical protein